MERLVFFNYVFIKLFSRERILGYIYATGDIDSLSKSKQFALLSRNLPIAVILIKVAGFNMKSWSEEMGQIFTTQDLHQFDCEVRLYCSFERSEYLYLAAFFTGKIERGGRSEDRRNSQIRAFPH